MRGNYGASSTSMSGALWLRHVPRLYHCTIQYQYRVHPHPCSHCFLPAVRYAGTAVTHGGNSDDEEAATDGASDDFTPSGAMENSDGDDEYRCVRVRRGSLLDAQGMNISKLTPPEHVAMQGLRTRHKNRMASPRTFSLVHKRPSPRP